MTKKASMHVVSKEEFGEAIAPVTAGNPLTKITEASVTKIKKPNFLEKFKSKRPHRHRRRGDAADRAADHENRRGRRLDTASPVRGRVLDV